MKAYLSSIKLLFERPGSITIFARIFLIIIFIEDGIHSIYSLSQESKLQKGQAILLIATCVSILGFIFASIADYLLRNKKESSPVQPSFRKCEVLLCLFLTAEWIAYLFLFVFRQSYEKEVSFVYTSMIIASFTSRTLLQYLIFSCWQLRLVAPLCAYCVLIGITISREPSLSFFICTYGLVQLLSINMTFYFHNIKKLTIVTSIKEEKTQLDIKNFILENTEDKLLIIDSKAQIKFISKNLQKLMNEYEFCLDEIDEFFREIRGLERCDDNFFQGSTSPLLGRSYFEASSISINFRKRDSFKNMFDKTESLDGFFKDFQTIITEGGLEEKRFINFKGKIRKEDTEKPIKVKISYFVQNSSYYTVLIFKESGQKELIAMLENNNKYKDRLLASVSHELRTPLNGNINLVEAALATTSVPENVKENLLVPALRSSKFLLCLINDILDMSQIQAQKLRLVFQSEDLRETFLNTLQLVELQAKKKGIRLEKNLDPLLPDKFCTDHVRLTQIVLNLISNSIKFTNEGFIRLSAVPIDGPYLIKISIEDTGIGMKKDDLKKLFMDFTHIEHEDRARMNPSGVGLGLNIAHKLAIMLGVKGNGGITVASTFNKGSTFSFVIQNKGIGLKLQTKKDNTVIDIDDVPPIPDEVDMDKSVNMRMTSFTSSKLLKRLSILSPPKPKCECPKILIIDDDPFNMLAYESILESLNTKCDCVFNGKSGIEKMLNRVRYSCCEDCKPYCVIFLDQEMPGMTGAETAVEIRKLQNQNLLSNMNIIACTAHESQEELEKFSKAGVAQSIKKPVSREVIKNILEKYL